MRRAAQKCETYMKMPSTTCQIFTTTTTERRVKWTIYALGSVRTEILFDDSGILEIYHLGRQAAETEVGRGVEARSLDFLSISRLP
jgi:hypothetical protein